MREEIIAFLSSDWTRTMQVVRESLTSDIELLQTVNDGLWARAGKQLRPMVSLLSARLCSGGKPLSNFSHHCAAASELLHNATLIHDDVADESSVRRGQPTLATLIGPSSAVLVGDFWLSKAVMIILNVDGIGKVTKMYSKTLCDLAEGEMLQLQNARTARTTEDDYFKVIYCKTASLFETACVSGAISVGATPEQEEALRSYAVAMGAAFQIKDDILDYQGGEALGKPMGVDLREGKITLPLLGALKNRPEMEEEIRKMVQAIPENPGNIKAVTDFVLKNRGVEYAENRLEEFIEKAESALSIFENSPQKDYLVQIARYNSSRKK